MPTLLEKWLMLVWPVGTGTHAASSIILPGVPPSWSQCALHCSPTDGRCRYFPFEKLWVLPPFASYTEVAGCRCLVVALRSDVCSILNGADSA